MYSQIYEKLYLSKYILIISTLETKKYVFYLFSNIISNMLVNTFHIYAEFIYIEYIFYCIFKYILRYIINTFL